MDMQQNPCVSVIIPTYNREHLLGRAISSVLSQTYTDFEIIVVDDNSSDNTQDIIKSFKDKRLRYVRHEVNKGNAAARNTGIKLARGDFIAFQDSDDEWFPGKLEKQIGIFKDAPEEVGVVYTGFWRIQGNKKIYLPSRVRKKNGDIHTEILRNPFIGTPSAMVKKICFEKAGIFDERIHHYVDWELWIRISQFFHFKCIDEPMLISYYTPGSLSSPQHQDDLYVSLHLILEKHFTAFNNDRESLSRHYYRIGRALYLKGDVKEGKRYFLKAMKIFPFNAGLVMDTLFSICGFKIKRI